MRTKQLEFITLGTSCKKRIDIMETQILILDYSIKFASIYIREINFMLPHGGKRLLGENISKR